MSRYHPLLVALHWIMALMIILVLFAGKFLLAPLGLDDPLKVEGAASHMTMGLSIGVLLIIRLITRIGAQSPNHAQTGNALLDRIGVWMHWVLYALVAVMVLSGLGMALSGGFLGLVAGADIAFLPENLMDMPPRKAHGLGGTLLFALLILHIVAALYHQFYLRDGLFKRMWFGARK